MQFSMLVKCYCTLTVTCANHNYNLVSPCVRPNKKIYVFTVTCQKNLGSVGLHFNFFFKNFLLSAKPEIVVASSGIRFPYFIFKIFGKLSLVEAVFINYDELCSLSTFFALNFDKKLAVE